MDLIIEKMKKASKGFNSLQEYAIHLMKVLDKNNDGFVDAKEFCEALNGLQIFVTKHEEHALLRRFDTNGDGKVSMEEFYNCLSQNF